jgi:hypothetical protein
MSRSTRLCFPGYYFNVLCLEKCFKMLIKEKSGLDEHINVTEKLIPSTFEEETNLLDTNRKATLKKHYMACYWKDFLISLEDSITQDSLIVSSGAVWSGFNSKCTFTFGVFPRVPSKRDIGISLTFIQD